MIEFNEPVFDCFTILPALTMMTMKRFILILPLAVTQIGVVLGVAINEEDVYCYT